MAKLGRRATYEERLRVCRLIESGESPDHVIETSGFGRSTVFGWWQTYRKFGSEALRTKRTPGPPSNLSDGQLNQLRSMIVEDLMRGAPEGPVLRTRKSVARIIDEEFGIDLSPVSVGRAMDRIGVPLVSPITRIKEAETERQWPVGTLATVQSATRDGAVVHYVWNEPLRPFRTFAEPRFDDRRQGILISSVGDSREVVFRAVVGSTGADAFIHLCHTIAEKNSSPGVPIIVVAESSNATCSGKVTRFFAATGGQLSLLLLPARNRRAANRADFEDAMIGGLQCGSGTSRLVASNDDRELDVMEIELALRSLRGRNRPHDPEQGADHSVGADR